MVNDKKILTFIVSLAMLMEAMDVSILNTAIPAMAQSFQVNPVDLKVALISYLLSLAIFIPVSGWVADKYGVKKVFITALAIFTLSSLFCGLAQNLYALVMFRAVQGMGGAMMTPVGRLVLARHIPRHQFIAAMAKVVTMASVGMMLGPVTGGLITHYLSWHWIFWINIPIGIFTILLVMRYLKHYPPEPVPPLDVIGFILFGSGLAGLTFGLSALSESIIEDYIALIILCASLILLLGYVRWSRRKTHPIVKTHLFTIRTFRTSILGTLFSRMCFGGVPFLLPLLMQVCLNFTPQLSGIMMAPMAMGVVIGKSVSVTMLRQLGYRNMLIINTITMGIALCLFVTINTDTSLLNIGALSFLYGLLTAIQYTSINSLAYADVEARDLSAVTSLTGTLMQLSMSFGVALSALLIRFFSHSAGKNITLTIQVFHHTFWALGLMTALSALIFSKLDRQDGRQMFEQHEA